MARPIYLCPICDREMLPTGFCHLVCPAGHYQEVCSDLFLPDRAFSEPNQPDRKLAEASGKTHSTKGTLNPHES